MRSNSAPLKPKFMFECRGDGGIEHAIALKNVSSGIVSNIRMESFELVSLDGTRENLLINEIRIPTSLGPNEQREFIIRHQQLQWRPIIAKTLEFVFLAEDENYNIFRCIATKDVEDPKTGYALGIWDVKVEVLGEKEGQRIAFPSINTDISCPVCGYSATIINTQPARDWAEIRCENCSTYAIKADALNESSPSDMYCLSGYFRHKRYAPLEIVCNGKDSIKEHISEVKQDLNRNYQIRALLRHYYQKMENYDQGILFERFPAIAYAKNEEDLLRIVNDAQDHNLLIYENGLIKITREGQIFLSQAQPINKTVFISYNWGSEKIADKLEKSLETYAEVKRDKTNLKPWGDIVTFMKSIRYQDFAVLVISDAYLKSDNCLYEVMELMKEEHWDRKTMYVVENDARGIFDTSKQLDYIGEWEKRETELEEKIKSHDPAKVGHQIEELNKIKKIALNIGEFMAKVKRVSNPDEDKVVNEIIKRVMT